MSEAMRSQFAALLFVFALLAAPAAAQTSSYPYGFRAGASVEPDQFYFGAHVETNPLVENLHFRPNVEIGVGNDATLVGINFELAYKFPTSQLWRPYAAAGPALNIARAHGESDAGGGFNIALGVEHSGGLFADVKVGRRGGRMVLCRSYRDVPTSTGPGHGPFRAKTRVRIPLGTPHYFASFR